MRFIAGLFLLISTSGFAQIPEGYYDGTDGLTKEALRSKLHQIIKGHKIFPYSSSGTDTWDILKESDRDPKNSNNVILVYTAYSVSGPAEYPTWNREHVWAKSHGDFGTSPGPGTDVHNLKPSDESVNSDRGNKDFDYSDRDLYDYSPASGYPKPYKTGSRIDDNSFEPRDEVKGDIARIIFYMDVRYDGGNGEPDLYMDDLTSATPSSIAPRHGKKSTLLKWHQLDPPDDFERRRNDVIYSYQKNRNPFIDHPEFVDRIWGNASAISLTAANSLLVWYDDGVIRLKNNNLTGGENLVLFDITGKVLLQQKLEINQNTVPLSPQKPGIYVVKIGSVAQKIVIQ
jgi:endonuclease I